MQRSKRFVFLGGVPVFDYLISVSMAEIVEATGGKVMVVGDRILLPVGTVFRVRADPPGETFLLNPMANRDVQSLKDEPYYSLEFGGKHPEHNAFALRAPEDQVFAELKRAFPKVVQRESDLKVVEVGRPASIHLGGNNKNIIEEVKTLYASPELAAQARDIAFEHHFFFDAESEMFGMIREFYDSLGVAVGPREEVHVPGLASRIGYVLTLSDDQGKPLDRIILANRTNEDTIPREQLNRRYFALEHSLRREPDGAETHLVVNSMTNPEELRLLARLLQTAHASGVICHLCPTLTFLECAGRLVGEGYYTREGQRFFQYRKDFLQAAVVPFLQYMILNRDELLLLDELVAKKGIDATASLLASRMNRGSRGEGAEGGKIVVTGGSKGSRYTERLCPDRAKRFWKKANLPGDRTLRFAERRIVCGDDYVTELTTTLGAGDVFSGIFIGLTALHWDGGHALRAATLGAQHFIQNRTKPSIRDMIEVDAAHIRLGTETELVDVISHQTAESGDPTRYGTIANTVITINTTQIHHPFRETLELALNLSQRSAA